MYAAVKRQGLDRASKKDIAYCTTWLRENGWRRVEKRLPDGQRVAVWRAPDGSNQAHPRHTQASELGRALTREGVATAQLHDERVRTSRTDATWRTWRTCRGGGQT